MSTQKQIAIIGGGFSSIHMAYLISKLPSQYAIHLFEKNKDLGGKINTIDFKNKKYDLGAVTGIRSVYREIEDLLDLKLNFQKIETSVWHSKSNKRGTLFSLIDRCKLIRQLLKYLRLRKKYFNAENLLSTISFWQFCRENNIPLVEIQYRAILTGCGYGDHKAIPVKYVFEYIDWKKLFHLYFGGLRWYPDGLQSMLIKKAHTIPGLTVFNNTEIIKVSKIDNKYMLVTAEAKSFTYDILISSGSHTLLQHFFSHPILKDYLANLVYQKYHICLVECSELRFSKPHLISLEDQMVNVKPYHPVMILFPHPNLPYAQVYYYGDETDQEDKVIANLSSLQIQISRIITSRSYFDYFPHHPIDNPLYKNVLSFQGKNNIYFIGEYFTMSALPQLMKLNQEVFSILRNQVLENG